MGKRNKEGTEKKGVENECGERRVGDKGKKGIREGNREGIRKMSSKE